MRDITEPKDSGSNMRPDDQSKPQLNKELVEKLADIEHERWSQWMRWLYQNGKWNDDGSFTIDPEKAKRWRTLMDTPYSDLDEITKEWDRIEVRKTLKALEEK